MIWPQDPAGQPKELLQLDDVLVWNALPFGDGRARKTERFCDLGRAVVHRHTQIPARNEPNEIHGEQRRDVVDRHQVGHRVSLVTERTLPSRHRLARISKRSAEMTAAQAFSLARVLNALRQAQEIVARGAALYFAASGSKQPPKTKGLPYCGKDLAENLDLSDELGGH